MRLLRLLGPMVLLVAGLPARAQDAPALTPDERAWLAAHAEIRVGVDPNWPPIEFVDQTGAHQGISSDYLRLLGARLGVRFRLVDTDNWVETLDLAKRKDVDLLPNLAATEQREAYLTFTKPYVTFPMVIVTRDDAPFVGSLTELAGQPVAVVRDYKSHDELRANHSDLTLRVVDDQVAGLRDVAFGQTFAFVGNLATIAHTIRREGFTNLKVAAPTPYAYAQRMGVRDDWPQLVAILEKGLATITPAERNRIYRTWIAFEIDRRPDTTLILQIAGGASMLLLLAGIWIFQVMQQRKTLARKEAQLNVALENMPGGMFMIDKDQDFQVFNRQYTNLLGLPDDVIKIGGPLSRTLRYRAERGDYGSGDVDALIEQRLSRYAMDEATQTEETLPDGRVIELNRKPIDQGGFVAIATDITARKQAEGQIVVREQWLRALLESLPDATVICDRSGTIRLVNKQTETVFGYSRSELVGQPIETLVPERYRKGHTGLFRKFIDAPEFRAMGSGLDLEGEKKSGELFPVSISLSPIETSLGFQVAASVRDITQRKRAEDELKRAFSIIRESVDYASNIQRSLLPAPDAFGGHFADHFVWWEPRDMVGGDFYWLRRCAGGRLLIVCDCTGHGVPGALMTLIGTDALNQALTEHPDGDPAALLGHMNRMVKQTLLQDTDDGHADDGMELGVCRIDEDGGSLTYAGARFALLINDGGEIREVKGDKTGIGYRRVDPAFRFTKQTIAVRPDMTFYLHTDGIVDQVGGDKRRAFGRKRLLQLLAAHGNRPLDDQMAELKQALKSYQGQESRRDDVTMIGFRL